MPWVTPTTVSTGDVLTATRYNADVQANLTELAPFFSAFTAITPTWTNLTIGNGTTAAYHMKIGRFVYYAGFLSWGSTTSATASSTVVSIPFTAATRTGMEWQGSARIGDAGTRGYPAECGISSAGTTMGFHHPESGNFGAVNSTNPMTWTTNDQLFWTIIYEAAS
jgi:hypothetical protein